MYIYHTGLTSRATDDLTSVAPVLEQELRKLEQMFTVDAAKLKEISMHFERELRQGLSRVSRCLLPSSVSPYLQSFASNISVCMANSLLGLEPEGGNLVCRHLKTLLQIFIN
jgi:hypothetical protein